MSFDYKKEFKEFYAPKSKPSIIKIPKMTYIAVRGMGDPNEENGEYKNSIGLLYAIAFTIKMSKKMEHKIPGYFEYVVPPLEGFWWQAGSKRIFILFPLFGCRISSQKQNLTGRSRRLHKRRNKIFRKLSF